MGLEEAVRRMTSMAARRLGLHDRGLLAPGMAADLVVFHPDPLRDRADFTDPMRYAEGTDYLRVNGTPVIDDGVLLGARPGRPLRRGGRWQRRAFVPPRPAPRAPNPGGGPGGVTARRDP